jgi:3-deoxy-D-manno-octulosonate 8-phosphate phosphatase (KDO 8-P phosphatase)
MSDSCQAPPGSHPSDCEVLEGYRTRSRERQQQPSEAERLLYAKAEPLRLLLLDVDGVLTDGSLLYTETGVEAKSFSSQDGLGLRLVQKAGVEVGIITARSSDLVERRARELEVKYLRQGVANKLDAFKEIIRTAGLKPYQVCYMGDDWIDLGLLTRVGLAASPANGVAEVQEVCHWVARRSGGAGAVRDLCDLIIRAKGVRNSLLQQFLC